MTEVQSSGAAAFLAEEYRLANAAAKAGETDRAWHHLERAHIVAQTRAWPHCQSHWRMLSFACELRDFREAFGQIFRLALAPIGNVTGRLPRGNTGRSNVSAFAAMDIPSDLQALLQSDRNSRR